MRTYFAKRLKLLGLMQALLLSGCVNQVFAVAYWAADYDVINPNSTPDPNPSKNTPVDFDTLKDLLRPSFTETSGQIGRSGVAIAPQWMLTAKHNIYSGGVFTQNARQHTLGGVTYSNNGAGIQNKDIFVHPTLDVALINLEERPTSAAYVDLYGGVTGSLQGQYHAIGGFGNTGKFTSHDPNTSINNTTSASKPLRWGQNISGVGAFVGANNGIGTIFDHPTDPGYLKYEGIAVSGDSGSGTYVRDGWDWKLASINTNKYSSNTGFSGVAITDELRTWITDTIAGEDPSGLPAFTQTSRPVPTTFWTGVTSTDWSTGGNWLYQQAPAYNAGTADVVLVNVASGPDITSSATAQDLYVGGTGGTIANTIISAGGTLDVRGLFLGAESTETGRLTINEGDVVAGDVVVGRYGRGEVGHFSGKMKTSHMVIASDTTSAANSTSSYSMYGVGGPALAAELEVNQLVLGGNVGSTGTFYMTGADASVDVGDLRVGARGVGAYSQFGGTVAAQEVVVGDGDNGGSSYSLDGGSLTTKVLEIGSGSSFTHNDGTLSINDAVILRGKLTLAKDGATFNAAELHSVAGSEVDFAGSTTTFTTTVNQNVSNTTFSNADSAELHVDDKRFVIVGSATAAMINATGSTFTAKQNGQRVTSANSAIHEAGTTFVIDGEEINGGGTIEDRVEVRNSGIVEQSVGTSFKLEGGISIDATASVDLGGAGRIVVPATGVGSEIVDPTKLNVDKVIVESGGHLRAHGMIKGADQIGFENQLVSSQGLLTVGEQNKTAEMLKLRSYVDGTSFANGYVFGSELVLGGADSQLEVEVFKDALGATQSDSIQASNIRLKGLDGTEQGAELLIAVDIADVSTLVLGSKSQLLDTIAVTSVVNITATQSGTPDDGSVDGMFSSVSYADASRGDFLSEDRLLAVVYENQFEVGEALASSDIGGCEGACAVIALPGDFNLDGYVDISDASVLNPNMNTIGGMTWADGDANGDGDVNSLDYDILSDYFNTGDGYGGGTASSLATASVPEPASLLLLAFGLTAVSVRRRR